MHASPYRLSPIYFWATQTYGVRKEQQRRCSALCRTPWLFCGKPCIAAKSIDKPVGCAQVIALLEAYARKAPQAALLARAVPVLLSSLGHALHAGPPQQALAERLRGLLNNKLCK